MNNDLRPINTIPNFKRFCMTIGELPTSYLETMSYYEMLVWFTEYMKNTIIPTINNNGLAIEELQDKYIELKSYVDNYFTNLDVQQEINNKLDQMVQDGTLQEIIASYLNSKAIFGFDNVASMKSATNLIDGSYAKTLGYYDKNDGGASLYKIRNITNSDIVNEMTIIALNDSSLIAELIFDNQLSSKQCGIKGDGETDETTLLNAFYNLDIRVNKILNRGIYIISNTLFIKGLWRQDTSSNHNNGNIKLLFDNATIKYTGTANNCSICFYNMFEHNIDGLSIDRTSNANYIDFIGCWHTTISNFDVSSIGIHKDINVLSGKTYETQSVQHISFNDGYVKGELIINPGESYTNGIYFNHVNFNATNYNYNVELLGTTSKQQIVFTECDLSYSNNAVFYIPEEQIGNIENSIGRCSVTCKSCYFDSNKPLFYQNNQNNIIFNDYSSYLGSGNVDQIETIKVKDYIKNTVLSSINLNGNFIPGFMINCCHNGNLENGGQMTSTYQIMGSSSSNITKTVIEDNSGLYGYAQRLEIQTTTGNINQYLYSPALPVTSPYIVAMRFKKVSGSGDIQISVNGQHNKYTNDMIPTGEEVIIVNNKSMQVIQKGTQLEPIIQFQNTNNLVLEVYECMIIPGRMLMCGLPLHGKCEKPSSTL